MKNIDIYCKCLNCGEFFVVVKRRDYCNRSCQNKAYYKRKDK